MDSTQGQCSTSAAWHSLPANLCAQGVAGCERRQASRTAATPSPALLGSLQARLRQMHPALPALLALVGLPSPAPGPRALPQPSHPPLPAFHRTPLLCIAPPLPALLSLVVLPSPPPGPKALPRPSREGLCLLSMDWLPRCKAEGIVMARAPPAMTT